MFDTLASIINNKVKLNERLNNPDLPPYFIPFTTNFYLKKYYKIHFYKLLDSIIKAVDSKTVVTILNRPARLNKLFHRKNISLFNLNYENPNKNNIITGKN